MLKKIIATLLLSMSSILFISINCFGGGLPTPDMCVKCHGFDIYDEWKQSKHNSINRNINRGDNVTCFDCHVSGKKVVVYSEDYEPEEGEIMLEPGEKQGFHILGYFNPELGKNGEFERISSPEQVCLRCHDTDYAPPPCRFRNVRDCHQCHMPVDGLKTYRLHKFPGPIRFVDDANNTIVKYVTREHRNHKFVIPSRRDCD